MILQAVTIKLARFEEEIEDDGTLIETLVFSSKTDPFYGRRSIWGKLEKDKEYHIRELEVIIKTHINE